MRADGSWVRIYPVPFRRLEEKQQFKKFDWLECDLVRNTKDPRPETYRPTNPEQFVPIAHMDASDNWRERRRLLLKTAKVFRDLQPLIDGAKANKLSLAVFKPAKIKDFIWEPDEREWNKARLEEMRSRSQQGALFEEKAWRETFEIVRKLPYSFSYRFVDAAGKASEMQILDWEIGALYWNCLSKAGGNEKTALAKVKEKYIDEFSRKDLHFFLGTTQQFHFVAPNPWVIVGVFPIPSEGQRRLFQDA